MDPHEAYSQPDDSVTSSEMSNSDHELLSFLLILMFTLVLVATLAVVSIFYVKRWQRRTRFFAHARLNENVEEITNPIFDECEDVTVPITNVSNNDDKVGYSTINNNELTIFFFSFSVIFKPTI